MKEIKIRYEISDEEYSQIYHILPINEATEKKQTTEAAKNEIEWDVY